MRAADFLIDLVSISLFDAALRGAVRRAGSVNAAPILHAFAYGVYAPYGAQCECPFVLSDIHRCNKR